MAREEKQEVTQTFPWASGSGYRLIESLGQVDSRFLMKENYSLRKSRDVPCKMVLLAEGTGDRSADSPIYEIGKW